MEDEPFEGFPGVEDGYTQFANAWFDILSRINNLAEYKIVMYVIRHTRGYGDECKRIRREEFAHGRKRRDGSRIDSGTGLGMTAVKDGVRKAKEHGYILCDVDDSNPWRKKYYYYLNMRDDT